MRRASTTNAPAPIMRPVEPSPLDLAEPLDDAARTAPPLAAGALRADAVLRLWLGLAFTGAGIALALRASPAALLPLAAGVPALLGRWPRAASLAGLLAATLHLARGPQADALAGVGLAAAAAARLALHAGESGRWLRDVSALRRALAVDLAATELARARAAEQETDARAAALTEAGDAYERAGLARRALERLGAPDGPAAAASRLAGAGLGRALRIAPAARRRLETRLAAIGAHLAAERRREAAASGDTEE